jgi:hypothetical protein
VTVKKKTLSFDEDLWAAVERRARESGTTPSAYVNELVARSERLYRGLQGVADWEAEHGTLTEDQLAWADRALAEAQAAAQTDAKTEGGHEERDPKA